MIGRIKILYISHSARIGGAEVCLLTLVKNLNLTRFEPVVVFPTPGPLRKTVADLGIRTYISPLEWWIRAQGEFDFKGHPVAERVEALARIMRAEQPQLVHSNTSVVWEGALAAHLTGVPHLWHGHEILAAHPVLRPLFPLSTVYEIMDELSQQVVVVAEAVKSHLIDSIDAHKLLVIPNGIDRPVANAVPGERSLRAELGLPADAVLVITVGSLVPEKGHDVLLRAASLVRQNMRQAHFILVGGGHPRAVRELKHQIQALGLKSTTHYLGFRHDVQRLIASSDLGVLPSNTDAFPLAVLEMMAARKPVVATASGGATEMIVNGESGYLVPVGKPAKLAAQITLLATDTALRAQMGRAAGQRFDEHYTAQIYVKRFQELYERMAAQASEMGPLDLATVAQWMQRYDELYAKSQATARSAAPLAWQVSRIARRGKQVARKWLYERE